MEDPALGPEAAAILDAAVDALVVTDADGSIVWLNRAAERTFGYERAKALGQEYAELVVPEQLRAASREGLARVVRGEPPRMLGKRLEVPALRADGSEFDAELTLTRAGDVPPRFTAWIRELTTAVGANRSQLRTLIERAEEAAGLGSWDWDVETGELRWSDNLFRLFGLEPRSITPTPEYVFERTHPDDRERVERQVADLMATGRMTPLEYRIVQEDGSLLAYLAATLAVVDRAGGRPTRLIGSVQDITARRRAEREVTAHLAVAVALAEWRTLDESAVALLRGLAESLDFVAGALWVPEERRLVRRAGWSAARLSDEVRAQVLPPEPVSQGSGPVREAWRERRPVHEGAAVALPVISGGELLALIELHGVVEVPASERLMQTLTGIGYEVGHFLANRRGELGAHTLTARELEVLQLAARGNTGPDIAGLLFLSPATVKTHFENIYAKLGVSDRAAAVAYGLRLGLIQ